jgi:transposase
MQANKRVVARHQVMELPEKLAYVTEHQAIACQCAKCGIEARGQIPRAILTSVCGSRLTALMGLLSARMHISRRDVATLLSDVLGAKISVGTVMACPATIKIPQ